MAMIVTVQDDQDPYQRTGRATQREDGSWYVEYFKPGGLGGSTSERYGDSIGYQVLPVEDGIAPDEAGAVAFMCETLADGQGAFGGIFPEPGYQKNRDIWPADRCTLCFEKSEFHDGVRADHPFTGPVPATAGDTSVRHDA